MLTAPGVYARTKSDPKVLQFDKKLNRTNALLLIFLRAFVTSEIN